MALHRDIQDIPVETSRDDVPAWLLSVPDYLVDWGYDSRGWERLALFLSEQGLPQPTLLQLAAARRAIRHPR